MIVRVRAIFIAHLWKLGLLKKERWDRFSDDLMLSGPARSFRFELDDDDPGIGLRTPVSPVEKNLKNAMVQDAGVNRLTRT